MTKPIRIHGRRPHRLALLFLLCLWSSLLAATEVIERDGFRFEKAPIPDWVEPMDLPAAWPADAPGADATGLRTWNVDWHTSLRAAEPVYYNELVVQPVESAKVADAARHDLSFNPDYQTLRIHSVEVRRDGQWADRFRAERVTLARREAEFESDMETGTVSALIVVDDVRRGDLVRLRWSIVGSNPILQSMWHDHHALAWFDPILQLRVRIDVPAGPRPQVRLVAGAPAPRWIRQPAGERLELIRMRIPAMPYEDRIPQGDEVLPALEVAARRSWGSVVDWALPLYPRDLPLPEELQTRVEDWRKTLGTEASIVQALQTVQEEVRYHAVLLGQSTHRPTPPAQTWARRYGDCKDKALLLSGLLRALGYDAVPALVSLERGIGVEDALPAATQFDHVIVRLQHDGQTLWLDPTLTHQRGPLSLRRANDHGVALAITAGVDALERMGPAAPSRSESVERFEIEADGRMRFTVETRLTGPLAESRRQAWLGVDREELHRHLADYYRRLHGELEVLQAPELIDDDATGVLLLREHYRLTQPWQSTAGGLRQFDAYADSLRDFVSQDGVIDRRHALARPHPVEIEQISEFSIPDDWQAHDLQDAQTVEDTGYAYQRRIERKDRGIRIRHALQSRADRIDADALKAHFDSLRSASQLLGVRLTFQPPQASLRKQREQRLRGLLRGLLRDSVSPSSTRPSEAE